MLVVVVVLMLMVGLVASVMVTMWIMRMGMSTFLMMMFVRVSTVPMIVIVRGMSSIEVFPSYLLQSSARQNLARVSRR